MPKNKEDIEIHPTAVVHPKTEIGVGVKIGPYVIIAEGVSLGDNTCIGAHTVVEQGTQIGKHCQVFSHSVLGGVPQSLKFEGGDTSLIIGDHSVIREFTTISRGTADGGGKTVIGEHCFIMAYAHIAHDCCLGKHVVVANAATLAGHIIVEDYAVIGGLSPMHQFVRIGAYAMLGGATGVVKDIVPYAIASGHRARIYRLNIVGLKRHGFSTETIKKIRHAYKLLFHSHLNTTQATEAIKDQIKGCPEVDHLLAFIKGTKRGICKKTGGQEGQEE